MNRDRTEKPVNGQLPPATRRGPASRTKPGARAQMSPKEQASIEAEADIDAPDAKGRSPLFLACYGGTSRARST